MDDSSNLPATERIRVSLLTGGMDPPYVLGLLSGLIGHPVLIDVIGNDEMKNHAVMQNSQVVYHNFRGNQGEHSTIIEKVTRIILYYIQLVWYALKTDSKVFHILWFNKFTYFDRTILNLCYKLLGKKLIYTAHNVNAGERDGTDTLLNRLTLRCLYRMVDHIIVHTDKMKDQLIREFGVKERRVTVIVFGINNTSPRSQATRNDARSMLGVGNQERIILFFGNIAPYKGLDVLVKALARLKKDGEAPKLLIAGKLKDAKSMPYWEDIGRTIEEHNLQGHVIKKIEFIPDQDVELYYKAADVLVLPYRHIFQSGVLFLAYSFGLPVIAADVGSLRNDIVEGKTGFVCRPEDVDHLADTMAQYFRSDLYKNLSTSREEITRYANEKYSWQQGGEATYAVYRSLQQVEWSHDRSGIVR
jgi:D-inositol-3-phosphate glycosyltransferase